VSGNETTDLDDASGSPKLLPLTPLFVSKSPCNARQPLSTIDEEAYINGTLLQHESLQPVEHYSLMGSNRKSLCFSSSPFYERSSVYQQNVAHTMRQAQEKLIAHGIDISTINGKIYPLLLLSIKTKLHKFHTKNNPLYRTFSAVYHSDGITR
jgi:hypothetical protein